MNSDDYILKRIQLQEEAETARAKVLELCDEILAGRLSYEVFIEDANFGYGDFKTIELRIRYESLGAVISFTLAELESSEYAIVYHKLRQAARSLGEMYFLSNP